MLPNLQELVQQDLDQRKEDQRLKRNTRDRRNRRNRRNNNGKMSEQQKQATASGNDPTTLLESHLADRVR